jgi:hypothetical protein
VNNSKYIPIDIFRPEILYIKETNRITKGQIMAASNLEDLKNQMVVALDTAFQLGVTSVKNSAITPEQQAQLSALVDYIKAAIPAAP